MTTDTTNRVLGLAQAYIVGLNGPEWLKMGLQRYSSKPSFMGRVDRLIGDESIVEERAVEMVLEEYLLSLKI